MPCLAMPCHALSCLAMPCHALSCLVMPCHALSCLVMPCHALSCLAEGMARHGRSRCPSTLSSLSGLGLCRADEKGWRKGQPALLPIPPPSMEEKPTGRRVGSIFFDSSSPYAPPYQLRWVSYPFFSRHISYLSRASKDTIDLINFLDPRKS
jgi:hypothetical protein